MDGYIKRTQKKRESILQAAQDLFFKQGYSSTTIAQIAQMAEVSQVTLYNYFGSKENLLIEVMDQVITRALAKGEEILSEEIPFAEKLEKIFALDREYKALMSPEFAKSIAWDSPKLQGRYQEIIGARALPFYKKLLEQGQAQGAFHPSITWEAFMAYTSAMVSLITQPHYIQTSQEYKLALHRLFYYGLLGR